MKLSLYNGNRKQTTSVPLQSVGYALSSLLQCTIYLSFSRNKSCYANQARDKLGQVLIRWLRYLCLKRTTFAHMALRGFYCGVGKDEFTAMNYLHDLGVLPYADTRCDLKRNGSVLGAKMYMGKRKISSGVQKPQWRCARNGCNSKRSVRATNAFLCIQIQMGGIIHDFRFMLSQKQYIFTYLQNKRLGIYHTLWV